MTRNSNARFATRAELCCDNKSLPALFTMGEITAALQRIKSPTAPGYDNVNSEFLKHLGPRALIWLLSFFSRIMAMHSIPKIWRKAKGTAIEKRSILPFSILLLQSKSYLAQIRLVSRKP